MSEQEQDPLAVIKDKNQRFYLRMYLRSNMDADQDIAKERCVKFGVDYDLARVFVYRQR